MNLSRLRDRMYHMTHVHIGASMYDLLSDMPNKPYFAVKNQVYYKVHGLVANDSVGGISGTMSKTLASKMNKYEFCVKSG